MIIFLSRSRRRAALAIFLRLPQMHRTRSGDSKGGKRIEFKGEQGLWTRPSFSLSLPARERRESRRRFLFFAAAARIDDALVPLNAFSLLLSHPLGNLSRQCFSHISTAPDATELCLRGVHPRRGHGRREGELLFSFGFDYLKKRKKGDENSTFPLSLSLSRPPTLTNREKKLAFPSFTPVLKLPPKQVVDYTMNSLWKGNNKGVSKTADFSFSSKFTLFSLALRPSTRQLSLSLSDLTPLDFLSLFLATLNKPRPLRNSSTTWSPPGPSAEPRAATRSRKFFTNLPC